MDIGLLKRFLVQTENLIINTPRMPFESVFLDQVRQIVGDQPVDDKTVLTAQQMQRLINVFHARDQALRTEDQLLYHYTMIEDEPINLQYRKLGYELHKTLDEYHKKVEPGYESYKTLDKSFLKILLAVVNHHCLNLDQDVKDDMLVRQPGMREQQEVNYRLHHLDRYNLKNCLHDEAGQDELKRQITAELRFDPTERRLRGGSYGQDYSSEQDNDRRPYFLRPEVYGLYVYREELYSILGLLRLNKLDPYRFSRHIVNNPSVPTYLPFCTRSYPRLPNGEINLNGELYFRPLYPAELFAVYKKDPDIKWSYSTKLNDTSYANCYYLIRENEIKHWHRQGKFSPEFVVDLIRVYLNHATFPELRPAFDQWCEQLIPKTSQDRLGTPTSNDCEWVKNINCLYGQIIMSDGTNCTYLIEVLLSVRYLLPQSYKGAVLEAHLDRTFGDLAAWYCVNSSQDQAVKQQRIQAVCDLFKQHANSIRDTADDYFNLPQPSTTGFEKLAKNLVHNRSLELSVRRSSGSSVRLTTSYQLLIQTLESDRDPVTGKFITDTPLTDCILSDDNSSLINFKHAIEHYRQTGQLLNVNHTPPRAFTRKEIDRVERNPRYQEYAIILRTQALCVSDPDPALRAELQSWHAGLFHRRPPAPQSGARAREEAKSHAPVI